MKHYGLLLFCLFILLLMTGCVGPIRQPSVPIASECAPANLIVQANDGSLYLKWDADCPDNRVLSGYYIYLQESPIWQSYHNAVPPRRIEPFNSTPYPGDTDPDNSFETMTINNLPNGVEYYVSVRTVFPDKTVTVSSNEVSVICRPEGQFELAFRYSAINDGYSFKTAKSVRADGELNDIYFYSKDGFDFIASPKRLNGFLRDSRIYSLGKTTNVYQYPELKLDIPPVEKIPVMLGESYLIYTADGNYAKIRIEDVSGEGKQRLLKISYIYQTVKDLMRF
jgi:hypothetical protein